MRILSEAILREIGTTCECAGHEVRFLLAASLRRSSAFVKVEVLPRQDPVVLCLHVKGFRHETQTRLIFRVGEMTCDRCDGEPGRAGGRNCQPRNRFGSCLHAGQTSIPLGRMGFPQLMHLVGTSGSAGSSNCTAIKPRPDARRHCINPSVGFFYTRPCIIVCTMLSAAAQPMPHRS
jgi:hypothetical protein